MSSSPRKLIVYAPVSQLSLGQFSFNILRELYKRKVQVILFPHSQPELTCFKLDQPFGTWIERAVNCRYEKVDRSIPSLALWHIMGSEQKYSDRQYLYTFHETSDPTPAEVNIVNQQDFTFFSSQYSADLFQTYGANNVGYVPLGLDEDFKEISHRLAPEGITHWGLVGKCEKRKNTELIVKTWVARYGGNKKHQLTLLINNPFYKPDQMNQYYANLFAGAKPFNVNVLPLLKTNAEMNHLYNSIDLDLSPISSAEGWNIPAHTCTCLGKWSIVLNHTGHKGWATAENSILLEPTGMRPALDGVFFHKNSPFNQGNVYDVTAELINEGFDKAEKLAGTPNFAGKKLREIHTYSNTVDQILGKIFPDSV
jgi:hypothetical protein